MNTFIKIDTVQRFINGMRNIHCCNVEPYGGCCPYMDQWQEGGGWSERSFIYCIALHRKIYTDPPIPKPNEECIILLPNDCPVRFPKGQMSLLDVFNEGDFEKKQKLD